MTPTEIVAKVFQTRFRWGAHRSFCHADEIITGLERAGYRIIAPGELDRETLERAAEVAESLAVKGLSDGPEIARAIRALPGKAGEA